ncbi:MAG TPA: Txe/YoeB family addiction module toxin [Bryobacteraceae bacterium]|nr:Txe/YoeB family addiction module toxin [Bryobacteraceae bacterium]
MPFTGPGKPEPLKHALKGCWSRRIDQKHRLVVSVS